MLRSPTGTSKWRPHPGSSFGPFESKVMSAVHIADGGQVQEDLAVQLLSPVDLLNVVEPQPVAQLLPREGRSLRGAGRCVHGRVDPKTRG